MISANRIINALLKVLKKNKMFLDIEDAKGNTVEFAKIVTGYRFKEDMKSPPGRFFRDYTVVEMESGDHKTQLLIHADSKNKIIIYFHGGAYVKGPLSLQWKTLAEFADSTHYDIAVLDYPKAPEYSCEATLAFCVKVYEKVLSTYKASDIIFMGDSAGGGLALVIAMILRDSKKAIPHKMILLSPWVDVSMTHREIPEHEDKDLILTTEGLIECGLSYSGDIDTKDWRVSPTYGDLSDLPETHVFAGGSELLFPDCRDVVEKAKKAGCDAALHYYKDMQHVWPIIPMIDEAKQAKKKIIELLLQ